VGVVFDGVDEFAVLGFEACEDMELIAAGDVGGVVGDALVVAVGVEGGLVFDFGVDVDFGGVHLDAEDASAAGPGVDEGADGAVVEVEGG